jgi:hypothetical protein
MRALIGVVVLLALAIPATASSYFYRASFSFILSADDNKTVATMLAKYAPAGCVWSTGLINPDGTMRIECRTQVKTLEQIPNGALMEVVK